jgi:hypothetical protein
MIGSIYEHKWRNLYQPIKASDALLQATATLNVVLYERTICRVQIQKEVIFVLKRGNQFLKKDVWESTRLTSIVL